MAIRSIAYVTMTDANTNYPVSTTDTRMGRVTIINDDGAAASNGNTKRVHVGGTSAGLTDKAPIAIGASLVFPNVNPNTINGRCTTALQVLTVIIED